MIGDATPRAFLYCLEAVGAGIAKVGTTGDLRKRMRHISQNCPYDLVLRHCLEVSTRQVGSGWEAVILAGAERYRSRGEWVCLNHVLDDLFLSVTDAVCVRDEMLGTTTIHGRSIASEKRALAALRRAEVIASVGHAPAFRSLMGDKTRTIVFGRLAEGYGAEDCQYLDGIPAAEFRKEVASLRASGRLASVMRQRGAA